VPARIDPRQRALFAPLQAAPAVTAAPAARGNEDRAIVEKLRGMAVALSEHFKLRGASIDAESPGIVRHYGICYADGRIRIRLRHATTGRLLKESSLVDTLCHELAHLKHFNHSLRFRRFYERILAEARRRGWYRPGPVRAPAAGEAACEIVR
jgi:hypothetical protein